MCVVGEKNMSKILIVEDDEKLSKELKIFLDKNGYDSVILQKFDNAVEDILEENADLILLDINLPYTDGEYICKEIRKTSDVPIIMVTSRDNEIDELYEKVRKDCLQVMHSNPTENINQGVRLVFIGRYLERIGDHSNNIAEAIM